MEITQGVVQWIDIINPKGDELNMLGKKFGIHPVILEELKAPSARAKVEHYNNYLFLVYQFPIYDEDEKVSRRSEIDLIITKKAAITVHYEELKGIREFKEFLAGEEARMHTLSGTLELTHALLETLINFSGRQLHHIHEKLEDVARALFKNREKDILVEVSYLKRDISEHRIIIRPQELLLKSLLESGVAFWGPESRIYLNDLIGAYLKLVNQLDDYREAVIDFEETNSQLMNARTTEVMKTFTILAFLTFPLMLFVSLFSMRTEGTPFIHTPGGFWIVIAMVLTAMALMLSLFKKKNWL